VRVCEGEHVGSVWRDKGSNYISTCNLQNPNSGHIHCLMNNVISS